MNGDEGSYPVGIWVQGYAANMAAAELVAILVEEG